MEAVVGGADSRAENVPPMRLSVAESTTPHLSFREDLELYGSLGIEGIGIHVRQKLHDPVADLEAFLSSGLTATVCMPRLGHVHPTGQTSMPTAVNERVDGIRRGIAELAPFSPVCCVCGPGSYENSDSPTAPQDAVRGLREVAQYAASLGLSVALEPLSPTLGPQWSSLRSFVGALELCEQVGEDNIGVLADIWHLWREPQFLANLRQNLDRVFAVQIDDWRNPTRGSHDRALPGDGIADVQSIVGTLRDASYSGWLDIEIMSDDGTHGASYPDSLWLRDPKALVETARHRVARMWDRFEA